MQCQQTNFGDMNKMHADMGSSQRRMFVNQDIKRGMKGRWM